MTDDESTAQHCRQDPKKTESVGVEIEKRKKVARVIFKGKALLLTAAQTAFIIGNQKVTTAIMSRQPLFCFWPFRNFCYNKILFHTFTVSIHTHPVIMFLLSIMPTQSLLETCTTSPIWVAVNGCGNQ